MSFKRCWRNLPSWGIEPSQNCCSFAGSEGASPSQDRPFHRQPSYGGGINNSPNDFPTIRRTFFQQFAERFSNNSPNDFPTIRRKRLYDLRVYAEANGGQIYHYRDSSDLECDAVVHLRNGSYGLIEIKLGGNRLIEEAASTLDKLASKIDTDRMKPPSFKMVLTATGEYAYRRKDGLLIVPIGCLRE